MKKLLLVIALTTCGMKALAEDSQALGNNTRYDDYYTVSEESTSSSDEAAAQLNPINSVENIFSNAPEWVSDLKAKVFSLLQFAHHNETYGDVNEPYNRKKHFGTWINDKHDDTCYNTRAKVLIRDSSTEVTFTSSGCTVSTGTWDEPYAGHHITKASDIQIDHFVPLKNAYVSGAYKWDYSKRCLYANFLGNSFHLISADGSQNEKKSDSSPELYMPPNKEYACQYLQQWLKVKMIWELGLTPPEKDAVVKLIEQNRCDLKGFVYSAQDLKAQRTFMADNMNLCQ
ncbi:HNH endonuclease family protein [Bdellovibrio sp. NC01]|uniref:HNH endonuclease family protein n=1 Tax=Bdellovibrio sp. NC01 TaxID=2220073 RepID=UPI0011573CBC|nr:HNH endonuclease family protein [Bdellovibrio sp. NC01]QDK38394.1 HNH endonuclease [Bdellovibrio sp. NC01]